MKNSMMRNLFKSKLWPLGLALLCLAASEVFLPHPGLLGQEEREAILAPLNQEFIKYLEDVKSGRWRPEYSDDGHPLGLIPSPLELFQATVSLPQKSANLPAAYDLRTQNKLTQVKNQGSCGSCWAFASYASLESFLKPAENWDFSEQNLIDHHGFDPGPCAGGNTDMAAAYLSRWSGPVKEDDDPYEYYEPQNVVVRKHVQDVIYIPKRADALDNNLIKEAVMNYGAAYVSMYYKSTCYNPGYYAYYNTDFKEGSHAVAVVGWDDNFNKDKFNPPAPGNGAFIAKNSWGTSWGDSGYFYVSYYDNFFGRRGFAAAFKAEPATAYSVNYYYDHLGWTTSLGFGSDAAWFSNIFTATTADPLLAVSFIASGSSNRYEIYIYKDVSSDQPRSGSLAAAETGTLSSPGYLTIPLKTAVALIPKQRFSVVVKLKTENYNYPIPIERPIQEYSSQANASTGQSYISSNGDYWTDLHTGWSGRFANSNVCLKSFAGLVPVYPPVNLNVQRLENDYIFFKEYVDRLSWEANSKNKTKIVNYKLYRKAKGAADSTIQFILELNATTFMNDQRGLKKYDSYTYRVTSVDEYGRESEPSEISN